MSVLELKKVSKTYNSGRLAVEAVKSVTLTISKGEIILIMGPSGSGKTTLLSMAGGLLKPTEGEIIIDGIDISKMEESKLAKVRLSKIGFIFQSFNLLAALSALENVVLASELAGFKSHIAVKKAKEALNELNLLHRMHALPENLSGGEKQRVAIARALVNDPIAIFADEPTANLDSKTGHKVMEQLRTMAKEKNRSIIIVSHDERIKNIADKILWLEDGQLMQDQIMQLRNGNKRK